MLVSLAFGLGSTFDSWVPCWLLLIHCRYDSSPGCRPTRGDMAEPCFQGREWGHIGKENRKGTCLSWVHQGPPYLLSMVSLWTAMSIPDLWLLPEDTELSQVQGKKKRGVCGRRWVVLSGHLLCSELTCPWESVHLLTHPRDARPLAQPTWQQTAPLWDPVPGQAGGATALPESPTL